MGSVVVQDVLSSPLLPDGQRLLVPTPRISTCISQPLRLRTLVAMVLGYQKLSSEVYLGQRIGDYSVDMYQVLADGDGGHTDMVDTVWDLDTRR